MYYMPKERLKIGRRVFAHALTKEEAAKEYDFTIPHIVNCPKANNCLQNVDCCKFMCI